MPEGRTESPPGFDRLFGLALAFLCGIKGNAWYLTHATREIARIRALGFQDGAYDEALARRGGTSLFGSLGLFFLFFVVIVVMGVAVDLLRSGG